MDNIPGVASVGHNQFFTQAAFKCILEILGRLT